MRAAWTGLALAATLLACSPDPPDPGTALPAYPNPYEADPRWIAQPHRDKPLEVVITADGRKAYVSLQGIPDDPGRHVAVVDLASGTLLRRIQVSSSPERSRPMDEF